MCTTTAICPHCLFGKFDEVSGPRKYFFGTVKGFAVSEYKFRGSLRLVGGKFGIAGATPHSCRITGARFWHSAGVSEGTIARLGDWRSIQILRQYLGLSALTTDLIREIRSGGGGVALQSHASETPSAPHHHQPAAIPIPTVQPPPIHDAGMAIASRRRPRKWHHFVPSGPPRHWWLADGDAYNPNSMDLQFWQEK